MLAQNLNVPRLIIEIDAKVVIDLLSSMCESNLSTHPYYDLFYDYRSLIQIFDKTLLQHTNREGNITANLLAKTETDL